VALRAVFRVMTTSNTGDGFGPDLAHPDRAIFCLHCGGQFRMDEMVYESRFGERALWRCPNPKCDGAGLGYDLSTKPWLRKQAKNQQSGRA
jgi:hypothetical protein